MYSPLIILDSKSAVCMANNGKGTKHKRKIARRVHLVRNGENCRMHRIDWCEGGIQLEDISTRNVGKHDLTPIIKCIMVRLDNWGRTLVQEVWQNKLKSTEQELCMNRIDWVEYLTQSVWNVCIKFDTQKGHWRLSFLEGRQCCSERKTVLIKKCKYRK